jgi:hypothetical protein
MVLVDVNQKKAKVLWLELQLDFIIIMFMAFEVLLYKKSHS